jgi:excisionase family DNA binding protein
MVVHVRAVGLGVPREGTAHMPHRTPGSRTARRLITVAKAAEYWSVEHKTIRRMIDRGELPAYRIGAGRLLRIDMADLERLTRRIPSAGDAA